MGFFRGIGNALNSAFGDGKAERAMAILNGDYAGAARINAMRAEQRRAEEDEKRGAAALQQLRTALAKEGHPPHVIDALMADPKRVAEIVFEKYRTREGGPGGISVVDRNPDGSLRTQHTPGWQDGNFFGGSVNGSRPQVIHENVKTVPVVPGGSVYGIGGATGRIINGASTMTQPQDPLAPLPDVLTDEDIIRMRGGAGRPGPQTFPYRPF